MQLTNFGWKTPPFMKINISFEMLDQKAFGVFSDMYL